MTNPFNPLSWFESTQNWFTRTELTSGFRPYLVYLFLCLATGITLLSCFSQLETLASFLIGAPILAFIPIFCWKAHTDPGFCRSESHVQQLKKIEMEMMGSESQQIDSELLEQVETVPEPLTIENISSNESAS